MSAKTKSLEHKGGPILKNRFLFLLVVVTLVLFSSGCLWNNQIEYKYRIFYNAVYDTPLNLGKIKTEFLNNNITIYKEEKVEIRESIWFRFKDPVTNESTPSIDGQIDNYYIKPPGADLALGLDDTKYPPTETREDAKKYKPVLERAKNYIEGIIYNATGLLPISSSYDISGDVY